MDIKHKFSVVQLPNGYLVSIQHSKQHMCSKNTVEVAVIYAGEFVTGYPCERHGVAPYVSASELIDIIEWAREQKEH